VARVLGMLISHKRWVPQVPRIWGPGIATVHAAMYSNRQMPRGLVRYQQTGDFHFRTFSCYRRLAYLELAAARELFESALEAGGPLTDPATRLSELRKGKPVPDNRMSGTPA
jgi:hypothetical protein